MEKISHPELIFLSKKITSVIFRIKIKKIFREEQAIKKLEKEKEELVTSFQEIAKKNKIALPGEKEKLFLLIKQLSSSTFNKRASEN